MERAFEDAQAFDLPPDAGRLADDQIAALARNEAAFGVVVIGEQGLPAGSVQQIEASSNEWHQRWRQARSRFDVAVEPIRLDLEASERLQDDIAAAEAKCEKDVEREDNAWMSITENQRRSRDMQEALELLQRKKLVYSNAVPTMLSYHWTYIVALLLIGAAEWLINYDVFLLFTGIPAIAAGATLILGVLLAFAAHAHGEIIRQWSYRFDRARQPSERTGSARLLVLATIALIVVLGAAGGSRYAAVLRMMSAQDAAPNILGGVVAVDVSPLRDVLLSLLANFAAWIVGVFVSFYCHDRDPDFMSAQRQHDKAHVGLGRSRRDIEKRVESIRANCARQVDGLHRSAETKRANLKDEHRMLAQVEQHGRMIATTLAEATSGNAERLRTALCQAALADRGRITFKRVIEGETTPLSLSDYHVLRLYPRGFNESDA